MERDFKRAFRIDRGATADASASVNDELAHHIDLCVDELVEQGWSAEEARAEAVRRFGDLETTREYCTEMQMRRGQVERRSASLDEVLQDLRYAFRTLRSAPGYTALVVVTLAFGIAANTTIFSVMNPYFFRALPFREGTMRSSLQTAFDEVGLAGTS